MTKYLTRSNRVGREGCLGWWGVGCGGQRFVWAIVGVGGACLGCKELILAPGFGDVKEWLGSCCSRPVLRRNCTPVLCDGACTHIAMGASTILSFH